MIMIRSKGKATSDRGELEKGKLAQESQFVTSKNHIDQET